jgi:hypothetical protein
MTAFKFNPTFNENQRPSLDGRELPVTLYQGQRQLYGNAYGGT